LYTRGGASTNKRLIAFYRKLPPSINISAEEKNSRTL
jgi:hypothetical protein